MKQPISLTQISINTPCPADWNAMAGDGQKRFCQGCQKHVHNLSAMTASEAEKLLCETSGRLCVRYEPLSDGTPKTLDYAAANDAQRGWKFWTLVGGTIASLLTGAHAMTTQPPTPAMMGDMVVAPCPMPATQPIDPGAAPVMGKVAAVQHLTGEAVLPATRPVEPIMGAVPVPASQPTTQRDE